MFRFEFELVWVCWFDGLMRFADSEFGTYEEGGSEALRKRAVEM